MTLKCPKCGRMPQFEDISISEFIDESGKKKTNINPMPYSTVDGALIQCKCGRYLTIANKV